MRNSGCCVPGPRSDHPARWRRGPPMANLRLMRPLPALHSSVSPCCAEVTRVPSGLNATDASLCPGRSGYFRCHTTRPLGISSSSSRWAVGTGEAGGEAVATATARRFPSVEGLGRHRPERREPRGDPGVGHHHVEPAEALNCRGDGLLQRPAVGDGGREADRSSVVELRRSGLRRLGLEIDNHDRGASRDECSGGLVADAARRARHEGALVFQVVVGISGSLTSLVRRAKPCLHALLRPRPAASRHDFTSGAGRPAVPARASAFAC